MPTVLVIEDDADIRTMIAETLAIEGYSVLEAREGTDALRCARDRRPDVILLDLMMPGMDGWTFRAIQRDDPQLARIPIVVVSACPVHEVHALDAAHHLHKPFDLDELLRVVSCCTALAAH